MKKVITYRWYLLLLALVVMAGCSSNKKELNKRVTLARVDKIPYGTWYAHRYLSDIFPDALIEVNKQPLSPYSFSDNSGEKGQLALNGKREALVVVARNIFATEDEATALHNFIQRGGTVFMSAFSFNDRILDSLHLQTENDYLLPGHSLSIACPEDNDVDTFSYPGYPLENYFSKIDSSITQVIGWDSKGRPNYVKFTWDGGGALFLHTEPLAFTNFFLLHKDNKAYYDAALSHLPDNISSLYWDDYFRSKKGAKPKNFSALGWLKNQPGLAAAMWLVLLMALIVYLFESKRKQRIIPVRAPLKNATVEFARTVGRLYLQRKDNNNLAYKMAAIFMDHVRRRFNVRTTMDDDFIEKLSHKSGYDKESLKALVYQLKYAQAHTGVTDMELLELQQQLDHFYQHT